MANLDAPILQPLTSTSGGEFLVTVKEGKEVRLPVHGILGLLASDVDSSVANTDIIATRLVVLVGTTPTVYLPAASGNLRDVIVMNTASGTAVIEGNASEQILTGVADAANLSVATGKSARLLSDGTRWYHITNDA